MKEDFSLRRQIVHEDVSFMRDFRNERIEFTVNYFNMNRFLNSMNTHSFNEDKKTIAHFRFFSLLPDFVFSVRTFSVRKESMSSLLQ